RWARREPGERARGVRHRRPRTGSLPATAGARAREHRTAVRMADIRGAGYAAVFAGRNEIDYRVYMAPGLLGMVVMFGALLAALSTVTDRDAGVLRMVLVAPIRRGTIALGKALGATVLGTTQAVVVAVLLLPLVH